MTLLAGVLHSAWLKIPVWSIFNGSHVRLQRTDLARQEDTGKAWRFSSIFKIKHILVTPDLIKYNKEQKKKADYYTADGRSTKNETN